MAALVFTRRKFLGTIAKASLAAPLPARLLLVERSAHAKPSALSTDPFAAGPGVRSLAEQAKSASQLEAARKLHQLLFEKLKNSSSGAGRDNRLPRTAEETLRHGGDCSEFNYAGIAACKEMGMKCGAVMLYLGKFENIPIYHTVQFVEAGGKRHLVDPRMGEFGKARVKYSSGKQSILTYEQAISISYMVLDSSQAPSLWFMEYGNFLQSRKGKEELAYAYLKRSLEIHPQNKLAKKKLTGVQGVLVNRFANKGISAMNSGKYRKALAHFDKALDCYPESLRGKPQHKQLLQMKRQAELAAQKE